MNLPGDVPAHPPGALREPAHAKVNLRLRVLAREEGGFHQLETLFCRLALHDDVFVAPAEPGITLRVEGADLGPLEKNLAWRAAALWYQAAGVHASLLIHLVKRIPAGAGLGGGSSDAAAVLLALDRLAAEGRVHGTDALGRDALLRLGASLGADVPFFVADDPLALAWGRGERLLPLPALPSAPVVVVAPAAPMETAAAYAALDRRGTPHAPEPHVLDPAALASWDGMAGLAVNDFEALVLERVPEAALALEILRRSAGAPALVTGSGSAVFGVFDSDVAAARAAEGVRELVPSAQVVVTATA